MSLPIIPTLALTLLLSLALYRYILYPALLSPLARIPAAHWSARFTRLWILTHRYHERETPAAHQAHTRLGPIVRLAPDQISLNCVDGGIRTIYAGGYEKGAWYPNLFTNYGGVTCMFAMAEHSTHAKRKRVLSNVYAKSTLHASAAFNASTRILLEDRLIPRLRELGQDGAEVDFYDVFTAITTDFVTAYVFGLANSSNFIQQPDLNVAFFRAYKGSQRYQFWPQDLPTFTALLAKIGLLWLIVPKWVARHGVDKEDWVLRMCDGAEAEVVKVQEKGQQGKPEHWPTVYAQTRNALLKEPPTTTDPKSPAPTSPTLRPRRLEVASELLDHVVAGFDTSSITLTFFAWQLSKPAHTAWQTRLRSEIASLPDKHDAKAIDALPVLHALVMETLRLHAPIPGNEPRTTPAHAVLGPPGSDLEIHDIPAGTRVQSQAWSLHRNPHIFPDPNSWKPERWLEASEQQHREMLRWFWAFGSGGRMCVGSNLALFDMKAVIVGVWGAFRTEVGFDKGMVHRGGYVAEPVGVEGRVLGLRLFERSCHESCD
ncbi:hypothetical protein LTR08_002422 [Meristemomyces frigidus]|nr:hypothetical protein LTR08_002422 [Meristemomyces frigidus]